MLFTDVTMKNKNNLNLKKKTRYLFMAFIVNEYLLMDIYSISYHVTAVTVFKSFERELLKSLTIIFRLKAMPLVTPQGCY